MENIANSIAFSLFSSHEIPPPYPPPPHYICPPLHKIDTARVPPSRFPSVLRLSNVGMSPVFPSPKTKSPVADTLRPRFPPRPPFGDEAYAFNPALDLP